MGSAPHITMMPEENLRPDRPHDPTVPNRSCGDCTLCCKVLKITALEKPQGIWCNHCNPRAGCTIYGDRPEECRTFFCGYLTNPDLGDEWKPNRSKIVLVAELDGNRIAAHVD